MLIAIDVHYRAQEAKAVAAAFEDWNNPTAIQHHIVYVKDVEDYVPGQFYKRELPCILEVLKGFDLTKVQAVIIDGYVQLDDEGKWGLGAYLYDALKETTPIIGIAKNGFHNNKKNVAEVLRGESKKPLYVTTQGVDLGITALNIQQMVGQYRMPDILQVVDRKTKEP